MATSILVPTDLLERKIFERFGLDKVGEQTEGSKKASREGYPFVNCVMHVGPKEQFAGKNSEGEKQRTQNKERRMYRKKRPKYVMEETSGCGVEAGKEGRGGQ